LRDLVGADEPALVAEAAQWEPRAEGLLFLPYLTGERTPHADPGARAAFAGLTIRHDRGALTRAVLEGVAYGLRDSLELLKQLGFAPSVGRVSGGGARSELWTEIVATVLGIPLERTAVDEGAAYGAALLAGVRSGHFADVHEAVEACVRVTARVEPNASWTSTYDEGYERFKALYPAVRAFN
jgi:xylulokinase